jgi:(1->4)-alpha-D-glucan 1-alpha-D-glucosylmutase
MHMDDESPTLTDLRNRAIATIRKSLREAKLHTSWNRPDEEYEQRLLTVVDIALRPQRCPEFWQSFLPFVQRVARLGVRNSLAQIVLKLTAPGVPDIYQGCESWDFSMVDPDNRRPVDYARLATQLNDLASQKSRHNNLLERHMLHWHDGHIKLLVTHMLLHFRSKHESLFALGNYEPVVTLGSKSDEVCVFMRQWREEFIVAVVTRFPARREHDSHWGDTRLVMPAIYRRNLRDLLTGRTANSGEVYLRDLLPELPVAVMTMGPA